MPSSFISRRTDRVRAVFLLRLLGGTSVEGPDGPLRGRVAQRRQLALLAVLGAARSMPISRDRICALLWADADGERARALLSDTLHVIRKELGPGAIVAAGQDLALGPGVLRSDVRLFEQAVTEGRPESALEVYSGPFLDGFHGHGPDGAEFERWVDTERARLHAAAVDAALRLSGACDARGDFPAAAGWARRALTIDPYHEIAARDLCRMLIHLGDRVGAIRTLETFTERLRADLGVDPDPATAAAAESPGPAIVSAAPSRRLAVLPFADLLNDPAQEYFVLGMHDGVIAALAQAHVPVIARTSVMCYARGDVPVREIGRMLGVQLVLEGSVVRVGPQVRIHTRLIDAGSEEHLWLGDYDIDLRDALGSHQRITGTIARAVQQTVQPGSAAGAAPAMVENRAYEAYLRGRFHYFRFTPRDMAAALHCFERALEHQPDYAQPHAGIASVHAALGIMGALPPDDTMPRSKAAALRALKLDATLPEAHHALAVVLAWYEFDFAAADAEFKRAVELDPSYADAHALHGHLLTATGRVDAGAAALERALALDPLNQFFRALLAVRFMLVGRYDDAITTATAALEVSGDLMLAHMCLWGTCGRLGRHEEALGAAIALFAMQRDDEVLNVLRSSGADDYQARMRAAADLLAARSHATFVRPFVIALMYDHAGDAGSASEWLETACRRHDHDSVYLGGIPLSNALRRDPRYAHLLRRMRLPDLRATHIASGDGTSA